MGTTSHWPNRAAWNRSTHKSRRYSDSPLYDEVCDTCGARDITGGEDQLAEWTCSEFSNSKPSPAKSEVDACCRCKCSRAWHTDKQAGGSIACLGEHGPCGCPEFVEISERQTSLTTEPIDEGAIQEQLDRIEKVASLIELRCDARFGAHGGRSDRDEQRWRDYRDLLVRIFLYEGML